MDLTLTVAPTKYKLFLHDSSTMRKSALDALLGRNSGKKKWRVVIRWKSEGGLKVVVIRWVREEGLKMVKGGQGVSLD
jgi:hypothetical protein